MVNILLGLTGVKPAQYIKISFGTNGRLQITNNDKAPAFELSK